MLQIKIGLLHALIVARSERGTAVNLRENPDVQAVLDRIGADNQKGEYLCEPLMKTLP